MKQGRFHSPQQWREALAAHRDQHTDLDPSVCSECGAPALDGTCDFCRRILRVVVDRQNARFDRLEAILFGSLVVLAIVVATWRLLL